MKRKVTLSGAALFLVAFFVTSHFASAAGYPARPIEFYATMGVGTQTGMVMRVASDAVEKYLGGSIQVIPVAGGGGMVGAAKAARAKPDGYTLFLCHSAANANVLYLNNEVPYKNSDFEFIAELGTLELGLVVAPGSPWKRVEDFIAYARKNPSVIKMAVNGMGTTAHLCTEKLKMEAGIKVDIVPYKTSSEVRTAILGGHCQAGFTFGGAGTIADEFQLVQEGGGRVLAVANKSRLKAYPAIPTLSEKGYNVVLTAWYGVGAPKNLPKDISHKLKDAFYKALKDPQVVSGIEKIGMRPEFRNSEDFTAYIADYEKVIKRIVETAKIPKN